MKFKTYIFFLLLNLLSGCAYFSVALKEPEITKRGDIKQYSFVLLPNTFILSASSGSVSGDEDGFSGSSSSKEINPSNIIGGVLLKKGLIGIDAVTPENKDKTLIVKYGESGSRDIWHGSRDIWYWYSGYGGYILEVTIVFVAANTNEIVYSCTAEGFGSTEVDDIREAIYRCLSGV